LAAGRPAATAGRADWRVSPAQGGGGGAL